MHTVPTPGKSRACELGHSELALTQDTSEMYGSIAWYLILFEESWDSWEIWLIIDLEVWIWRTIIVANLSGHQPYDKSIPTLSASLSFSLSVSLFFYLSPSLLSFFIVADTLCPSIPWSVRWSVTLELKSRKTRISAPAHPSATGGRVSGLVFASIIHSSIAHNSFWSFWSVRQSVT